MKKCSICKQLKPTTEFNKNKSKKDNLNTLCRVCSNERSRQFYKEHKHQHKTVSYAARKRRENKNNQLIIEYKNKRECQNPNCTETQIEACCLDFHHKNPRNKQHNISIMKHSYSWEKIAKEIAKCIVLCSNCHKKLHAGLITI